MNLKKVSGEKHSKPYGINGFKENSMKLYAFQNKKTKKLVTGTDFRYFPNKQLFCEYNAPVLLSDKEVNELKYALENELHKRMINLKNYDLVECELSVVKRVTKKEIDKIIKGENKWKCM